MRRVIEMDIPWLPEEEFKKYCLNGNISLFPHSDSSYRYELQMREGFIPLHLDQTLYLEDRYSETPAGPERDFKYQIAIDTPEAKVYTLYENDDDPELVELLEDPEIPILPRVIKY